MILHGVSIVNVLGKWGKFEYFYVYTSYDANDVTHELSLSWQTSILKRFEVLHKEFLSELNKKDTYSCIYYFELLNIKIFFVWDISILIKLTLILSKLILKIILL